MILVGALLRTNFLFLNKSSQCCFFFLLCLPSFLEINPNKGRAGAYVTVTGNFLLQSTSARESYCKFGSSIVTAYLKSNDTLSCTSPPSKPRKVSFQVSLNGGLSWSLPDGASFEYFSKAKVERTVPSFGIFKGGTPVAIYGGNFANSILLTCQFGGINGTKVVWVSSTQVNCVSPATKEPSVVQVQISNNGIDFSTDIVSFEYQGYPFVVSIFPSFGFPGTVVSVFGKNFLKGSICKFGIFTTNATSVTREKLECIAPVQLKMVGEGYTVHVQVSSNGLDFSSRAHPCKFTYVNPPIIHFISSADGFMLGGELVSINGAHLNSTGDAWCIFTPIESRFSTMSNVLQKAIIESDSNAHCMIPPQADEVNMQVRVSVNAADDHSAIIGSYKYHRAPRIVDLIPRIGSLGGGTTVLIIGFKFPNVAIECIFGSTTVIGSWISATTLQCTSPALTGLEYEVPVVISLNGIHLQSGITFYYNSPDENITTELSLQNDISNSASGKMTLRTQHQPSQY